jgi:hypothetical protein
MTQTAAEQYLNANAPPNTAVYIHDTTFDAWAHMQEEGRVRRDLHPVGAPHESTIAMIQHELHMNEVEYGVWIGLGTTSPAYIVTHDGVPIVSVYRR